jgi:hypothetical protein
VPFSDPGCLIWVKLRQFDPMDQTQMVRQLDTEIPDSGFSQRHLHSFGEERITEIVAGVGASVELAPLALTQELLILEGEVWVDQEPLPAWSWLRIPVDAGVKMEVRSPARVFWKTRPVFEI